MKTTSRLAELERRIEELERRCSIQEGARVVRGGVPELVKGIVDRARRGLGAADVFERAQARRPEVTSIATSQALMVLSRKGLIVRRGTRDGGYWYSRRV